MLPNSENFVADVDICEHYTVFCHNCITVSWKHGLKSKVPDMFFSSLTIWKL